MEPSAHHAPTSSEAVATSSHAPAVHAPSTAHPAVTTSALALTHGKEWW